MFALILFGVPGAGKSTIASRLQAQDPLWLVFDTDDFAMSAREHGLGVEGAFAQSFEAFDRFLTRNQNWSGQVCLSASLASLEKIRSVESTLSKLKVKQVWVKVTCSLEEAHRRVRARDTVQADDEITERRIRDIEHVHARIGRKYYSIANPNGANLEYLTETLSEILHSET